MSAPVLVIGATGTTGSRVVRGLRARTTDVRAASRTTAGTVHFDWHDPRTWPAALDGVAAAYVIGPTDGADPAPVVRAFLETGAAEGLRRVVLLSSSALAPALAGPGALPDVVRSIAPEWAVLRPSWFMSNVLGNTPLAAGLRAGSVHTATGEGRVAFIDPDDIAAVAVEALLSPTAPNTDLVLTGPDTHSYAELCNLVGTMTGRTIRHTTLSVAEYADHLSHSGIPTAYAPLLASLDESISRGSEDRVTDTVERLTGRRARSLADFLAVHQEQLADGSSASPA